MPIYLTLWTIRLFTASVREYKSSFPTHQYRLRRYLATLVFPARSKSLFGRPLLLHTPSLPIPTFQQRVASQLHEETDAWRHRCQTWNGTCAVCAARAAIWKLSRHPCVLSIETCSNAICQINAKLHLFCAREDMLFFNEIEKKRYYTENLIKNSFVLNAYYTHIYIYIYIFLFLFFFFGDFR